MKISKYTLVFTSLVTHVLRREHILKMCGLVMSLCGIVNVCFACRYPWVQSVTGKRNHVIVFFSKSHSTSRSKMLIIPSFYLRNTVNFLLRPVRIHICICAALFTLFIS